MSVRDYFGANASLPKAVQWHVWFEHWNTRKTWQPAERFFVDAITTLQQLHIKIARALRKEEAHMVKDLIDEKLAWYQRNVPALKELAARYPEWVVPFQALEGLYLLTDRLGTEVDQANRRGYLLVNTGEEARELAS